MLSNFSIQKNLGIQPNNIQNKSYKLYKAGGKPSFLGAVFEGLGDWGEKKVKDWLSKKFKN